MEKCQEFQVVMNIDCHTKIFGFFPENDQNLLKHVQGVLKDFLRSVYPQEVSLAVSYPTY